MYNVDKSQVDTRSGDMHIAVGRWAYQAKEEEQINVALFVA
jgi:hypothetical protein